MIVEQHWESEAHNLTALQQVLCDVAREQGLGPLGRASYGIGKYEARLTVQTNDPEVLVTVWYEDYDIAHYGVGLEFLGNTYQSLQSADFAAAFFAKAKEIWSEYPYNDEDPGDWQVEVIVAVTYHDNEDYWTKEAANFGALIVH